MNETRTLTIELLPTEASQLLDCIADGPTRAMRALYSALEQISQDKDVRVPDELCGDYPAPCNCNDVITHSGH
jgi:hypothetical protein